MNVSVAFTVSETYLSVLRDDIAGIDIVHSRRPELKASADVEALQTFSLSWIDEHVVSVNTHSDQSESARTYAESCGVL
jgi:hypothetical protein